jgi:hypothetical protein
MQANRFSVGAHLRQPKMQFPGSILDRGPRQLQNPSLGLPGGEPKHLPVLEGPFTDRRRKIEIYT